MTNDNSEIISFLRFPLTFAVVAIHCMGNIETQVDWLHLTGIDLYYLLKVACSSVLFGVAVPMFFFISGYLFFVNVDRMDKQTYYKKIRRRLHSLLIPYVTWNLLAIPLILLSMYGETLTGTRSIDELTDFIHNGRWTHIFWDFTSHPASFSNIFGWAQLRSHPVLFTLWYVRDLMIMCLLSPLVYWYIRHTGRWGLVALTAVFALRIWPYISVHSVSLFFVFGAYWALNRMPLAVTDRRFRLLIYLLALVLGMLQVRLLDNYSYWGSQTNPLFLLVACLAVFCLADSFLRHHRGFKLPALLGDSSFFIYALHAVFGLPLGFFLTKAIFKGATHPLLLSLQYVVTACMVYLICLATYFCLSKIWPKALLLLNGNRGSQVKFKNSSSKNHHHD